MTAVTDDDVESVRALVAAIPSGRVATYGDIASAAGLFSPRIVGWIMRTDSADLPWHRVIRSSGRPAPHLTTRQLELLRAEGVLSVDGRYRYATFATRSEAACRRNCIPRPLALFRVECGTATRSTTSG